MARDGVSHPALGRLVLALALVALGLWTLVEPRTADLAAQVYRADVFRDTGWTLWNNYWFGGHYLPNYSLLSPWLMASLGVGTIGLLAALTTTAAFAGIARRLAADRWRWPAAWMAWSAVADLLVGRVTYALGQAVAMLAVLALVRAGPPLLVGVLAAASAAASPVAGLFLALVLALAWSETRGRAAAAGAASALLVTVAGALAFPDGGTQPYSISAGALAVGTALAARWIVDPSERLARRGLLAYAAIAAACVVVPTPMGSNIARLGVALIVPVTLLAQRRSPRVALALLAATAAVWLAFAPITELNKAWGARETQVGYYRPLLAELARRQAPGARLELVPSASRWEVVRIARRYPLARGWETQLDRVRNALFYEGRLSSGEYLRWLRTNAVGHVALSDAPKERWGRDEERLLRQGVPGLREVWRSAHWRLFAVSRPLPLARGARVVALAADRVVLDVPRPGSVGLRIRFSRFWSGGDGVCVRRRDDGFMAVDVARAGIVRLHTSLAAPFDEPAGCRAGRAPR